MQKDNSSLLLVVVVGLLLFMQPTATEVDKRDVILGPDEKVAFDFLSEYARLLGEGFESSALLISDEDSIPAFHKALSTSSQKARIDAAALTVDPYLQNANEAGPLVLQKKTLLLGQGFVKIAEGFDHE